MEGKRASRVALLRIMRNYIRFLRMDKKAILFSRSWFKCGRATMSPMRRVADACGALKLFVNVATIRSDAFWFSAVR